MVDNSSKMCIKNIKNKTNKFEKKVKILFKKLNENKPYGAIEKFLKNYKNKINLNRVELNYTHVLTYKNLKKTSSNTTVLYFLILVKKKQTFINLFLGGKKILHNTNGIFLKKNGIIEKSRKKDLKTSLLNLNISINFLKNLNLKNKILINIKKIKPFLTKINKIIKNELFNKNITYVLTPEISFNKNKFKKVKSIKRRIRKKYNLIDV